MTAHGLWISIVFVSIPSHILADRSYLRAKFYLYPPALECTSPLSTVRSPVFKHTLERNIVLVYFYRRRRHVLACCLGILWNTDKTARCLCCGRCPAKNYVREVCSPITEFKSIPTFFEYSVTIRKSIPRTCWSLHPPTPRADRHQVTRPICSNLSKMVSIRFVSIYYWIR